MGKNSLTIIDNENLRGIVGPASTISKELLEDMADLVGYASPNVAARINRGFRKSRKLTNGRTLRKKLGV